MYLYPDNLTARPMLWLWALRDVALIGIGLLLSALGFPLFTAHIHFIVVQRHGVVLPILNDALLYCISSDKTRGYSPK